MSKVTTKTVEVKVPVKQKVFVLELSPLEASLIKAYVGNTVPGNNRFSDIVNNLFNQFDDVGVSTLNGITTAYPFTETFRFRAEVN